MSDTPIGIRTEHIEAAAAGLFQNWAARASLTTARPSREAFPIDLVVINDGLEMRAVQLKAVLRGGFTVHRKYLGLPLKLAYVFLGREAGGLADRTYVAVLTPEQAWSLPQQLGMSWDDEFVTYRFSSMTRALQAALEPVVAHSPSELAARLFEGAGR